MSGAAGFTGGGATKKRVPQSAFTQDVVARGSQAIRDRQAQTSLGAAQGPQRLEHASQSGLGLSRSPAGNSAYEQWYAQQGFHPDYEVTFGRTPKGAYSGFKTEGELKAAVAGRAEQMRDADRQGAGVDYERAVGQLDDLDRTYTTRIAGARQEEGLSPSGVIGDMIGMVRAAGAYGNAMDAHPEGFPVGLTADANTGHVLASDTDRDMTQSPLAAGANVAAAEQVKANNFGRRDAQREFDDYLADYRQGNQKVDAYRDDMRGWLAGESEPLVGQAEAAQMRGQVPLADYATRSGAEYGVDPNLIAGWYNDASQVSDFNTQRNLDSIDEFGMPYTDMQSWVSGQQRQAAQEETAATAAQKQADADFDDEQSQQIGQLVYERTGMDVKQMAQAANLTPEQVAGIVSDPTYEAASTDLYTILADPEFGDQDANTQSENVSAVLDQLRQYPDLYRLIQVQYGAYFS